VEAEEAKAVKFLWKRKRKQTWKRPTLYGAGSGSKKYSTASTSLIFSPGPTLQIQSTLDHYCE